VNCYRYERCLGYREAPPLYALQCISVLQQQILWLV
jgi:hypothetical protein